MLTFEVSKNDFSAISNSRIWGQTIFPFLKYVLTRFSKDIYKFGVLMIEKLSQLLSRMKICFKASFPWKSLLMELLHIFLPPSQSWTLKVKENVQAKPLVWTWWSHVHQSKKNINALRCTRGEQLQYRRRILATFHYGMQQLAVLLWSQNYDLWPFEHGYDVKSMIYSFVTQLGNSSL